jgi:hypothetical protein
MSQVDRQPLEEPILLVPSDGIRRARRFSQHCYQGRQRLEPWIAFVIAVSARCTIENRANDFERAIDRGGASARCKASEDKWLQRPVVHPMRLEVTEMGHQEANVLLDCLDASLVA